MGVGVVRDNFLWDGGFFFARKMTMFASSIAMGGVSTCQWGIWGQTNLFGQSFPCCLGLGISSSYLSNSTVFLVFCGNRKSWLPKLAVSSPLVPLTGQTTWCRSCPSSNNTTFGSGGTLASNQRVLAKTYLSRLDHGRCCKGCCVAQWLCEMFP